MIVDKLGVSLSQAARELGITRAALRTYVDLGKLPKIDKIEAIAKSSDHSISWLLTGLGPMQPFEGLKEVSSVSLGAGAPVPLDDDQENDRCIREVESFRTLLEDAVRRRDQRLLGWLAIEMNVWRKQIEARFPELGRDHSLPGEGEV
jgi:transcriptional regulator with XRE-family HTH domain